MDPMINNNTPATEPYCTAECSGTPKICGSIVGLRDGLCVGVYDGEDEGTDDGPEEG